jgi:hypothetical protein
MYSLARDIASRHGYTVLQAVQEWDEAKNPAKGPPLGEAIQKFLAAKASRSAAYTDKLLYVLSSTSVLGAILLTGYLGGAIATHVRVCNPLFSHALFPVYLALLLWGRTLPA